MNVAELWHAQRYYQKDIIKCLRAEFMRGVSAVCLCSPTGSGKTIVLIFIAASQMERGKRSIVLLHRKELVDQVYEMFREWGVPCGVISRFYPFNPDAVIQIASAPLLASRISRGTLDLGGWRPDLIILDESHHCCCPSVKSILAHWSTAKILGVTATPSRLDGKGLGEIFESLVVGPSVRELIDAGFLAPYRAFSHPLMDRTNLRKRRGDFTAESIEEALAKVSLGDPIAHYEEHLNGKPALVFCSSIKHANEVAQAFSGAGHAAANIDGTMSNAERRQILGAYASGQIKVLVSVDLLGEGLDVPATQGAILLRPTASLTLCMQQLGRILRPKADGSPAIILDHVANLVSHGLPCAERRWSLEGLSKDDKKSNSGEAVKVCRRCEALNHLAARQCVACGDPFPVQERSIQQVNGKLREIDPKVAHLVTGPLRFAVRRAASLAELEEIAKARVGAGVMHINFTPITWARRVWRTKLARTERNPHRRAILEAGTQYETEALLRNVEDAAWLRETLSYSERWLSQLITKKEWM